MLLTYLSIHPYTSSINLPKPQSFASFNTGYLDSCDSVCQASY